MPLGTGWGLSNTAPTYTQPYQTITATTATTTNYYWFYPATSTTTATNTIWFNGSQYYSLPASAQDYQQALYAQQAALYQQQAANAAYLQGLQAMQQRAHHPTDGDVRQAIADAHVVANRQQRRVLDALPKTAQERARELLMQNLTPQQREQFEKHGFFVIEGGKSRKKYRVRGDKGLTANVDVLSADERSVTIRLCAHGPLGEGMPLFDHLLAQKLMLESDEDAFIKIANRHAA
jgi:hypothetical protein